MSVINSGSFISFWSISGFKPPGSEPSVTTHSSGDSSSISYVATAAAAAVLTTAAVVGAAVKALSSDSGSRNDIVHPA
eukprot:13577-Heterococcus_DN1.PRE.2